MDLLLTLMQIVALACLSVLSIYMITVLVRLRATLTQVEQDLHQLTSKAIPVFENLDVITTKVKDIAEGIDSEMELVKQSIRTVRGIADSVVEFERRVQRQLEEPVMQTVSIITGVLRGFRTFVERLRA